MEFKEFKNEILRRAKEANACTEQYRRAYKSNDFSELMRVIKDNFNFAVRCKVIDAPLIETCKDEFNENKIYCNVDVSEGFLLASGSATVKASGSATVEASGSATVKAWDSATVKAWDSATVEASGSATVKAWDSATVKASGSANVKARGSAYITSIHIIECKLSENAIYRIRESDTVRYVSDNIKFEKVQQ
jgi:hypothetical protein